MTANPSPIPRPTPSPRPRPRPSRPGSPCRQTKTHPSAAHPSAVAAQRSAFILGYSLHANVCIHRNDREGLERLCRYGLRPAFALDRLAWTDDIEYTFKRPAPDGRTRMVCPPVL